MPTSSDDWRRLATYLVTRAGELGLTQTEIAARGGPSTTLWRALTKGKRRNYAAGTLGKIDRSLDWEHGSAERILHGGDPSPRRIAARPTDPYLVGGSDGYVSSRPGGSLADASKDELLAELARRMRDDAEIHR